MDINAVIAEATSPVAEQAKASPEVKPEAKTETAPAKEAESTETVEAPEPQQKADSELTEDQLKKREANRQSHLNSKLAKMRRENRELREAVERNQPQQAQAPTAKTPDVTNGVPVKPVEDKFSTWGEYQDAMSKYHEDLADWKIEQKFSERDKKIIKTTEDEAVNAKKVERINAIVGESLEFTKQNPDFKDLMQEYNQYFNGGEFPEFIESALFEAEQPIVALYALMKEGKLESLEDMSPYKISMEIGKAEIRGISYLNQNKSTNAPTPMSPARGTATAGKPLDKVSVEELMQQFNTR